MDLRGDLFFHPVSHRTRRESLMSVPRDIQEFLDQYPDVEEDPNCTANFDFYSNAFPCQPDNRLIDYIHENWLGNYNKLEYKHGYIQWLFPIREYGMNYQSQPLQTHEIEAMKADPVILGRIIESYKLMLDFFGMRLISAETGLVDRVLPPRNFVDRYNNLVRECSSHPPLRDPIDRFTTKCKGSSHNYLRVSRILKCLSEMGLEHINGGFLLHVLNEQSECDALNTRGICRSMDQWWANCIRNDEEREWIRNLIVEVRSAEDGFIFTRQNYEKALETRLTTGKLEFREESDEQVSQDDGDGDT